MIGLSSTQKRDLRTHEGRMLRIGFAKLIYRLESEATTLTAYRFFECESNCPTKRNWEEHPSHTDEDAVAAERVAAKHLRVVKVATESNPVDMLTKRLGRSKVEESCAEIGQTKPRAETVDNESKGAKKPKEVKFAVKTMEMNEAVKNKLKDARISKIKNKLTDARIAKVKNESKDAKLRWMHAMD